MVLTTVYQAMAVSQTGISMGVELMQKIVKDQFRVPASFGRSAHSIWQAVLAQ